MANFPDQETQSLTEKIGDSNIEPNISSSNDKVIFKQKKGEKSVWIIILLVIIVITFMLIMIKNVFSSQQNFKDDSIDLSSQHTQDTTILRQQQELMSQKPPVESKEDDMYTQQENSPLVETVTIEPPPPPKTKQFSMIDWSNNSENAPISGNNPINPNANEATTVSSSLNTSVFISSVAKIDRINPTYRVGKGTSILCTLQTRVDTSRPGVVTCLVSKPVYSDDGKMILIDKGSLVVGEQNSGLMNTNRAFITWYEVRTPFNVVINIQSPASDSLGASGVTGKINHQILKKFLAGTMISILNSAEDYIKIKNSKHNELNLSQNMDIENYLKNEFIQERTLVVDQGTLVNIQLVRDLDFSKVYQRF
ncbi:MAG: hypothetical protein N4Q30_00055 [Neisseriaceae bacterium]|nr:hypothetical protein [Neisseriaceae bacterium]